MQKQYSIPHFTAENLLNVKHGFFGKNGGVSKGNYKSLNCGLSTKDAIENVNQNRMLIASTISTKDTPIKTVKQVHGNKVCVVGSISEIEEADALVTKEKQVIIGVLTADCAPVLFYDDKNGVIGAAHAGWRSAFTNIVSNTINAMCEIGSDNKNINMAIGPCIDSESYEVDASFFQNFMEQDKNNNDFFYKIDSEQNKFLFDLQSYILRCGEKHNINSVSCLKKDTYAQETEFFSHRRQMHKYKNAECGRQLSVIML